MNYPVIYLQGLFDWEGYYKAAGLSYEVDGDAVDDFNDAHEYRVYMNGPLQEDDEFELLTGVNNPDQLYTSAPYFQDIPVTPGQSYKIQVGVYNTETDQETRSEVFEYTCPAIPQPNNLQIQSNGEISVLTWDTPDSFPGSGAFSDDGPLTWKVTANGTELNRSAGGSGNGYGPGAPVQLLTGVVDPGDNELVVTPVFEDLEGNVYEYENATLDAEIPDAPENFAATVSGDQVNFSWDAVAGVDGYDIYVNDGGGYTKLNGSLITGTTYQETGVAVDTFDAYVVAVIGGAQSAQSNIDNYEVEAADGIQWNMSNPDPALTVL